MHNIEYQNFEGLLVEVIIYDHRAWLSSEQISNTLKLSEPDSAPSGYYHRHRGEFTDDMSTILFVDNKKIRLFDFRACHILAFLIHSDQSQSFRYWLLYMMKEYATLKGNPTKTNKPFNTNRLKQRKLKITTSIKLKIIELLSLGESQASIARKLGVSRATVNLIANGKWTDRQPKGDK